MASGTLLQMDQAASADQGILRAERERGQNPNLDRRVHLRARGYRPQASRAGSKPLPNSTDSQSVAFRKNAHFTGTSAIRLRTQFTRPRQSADSVQLIAGQQWSDISSISVGSKSGC